MSKKADKLSLSVVLTKIIKPIYTFRIVLFFCVVALLYGGIIWRINSLANQEPTETQTKTAQDKSKMQRINPSTAEKMRQLQDNSVRVQTLFEEARKNPFNE